MFVVFALAGGLIGFAAAILIFFVGLSIYARLAIWRERDSATVTRSDTALASGITGVDCPHCWRLVGQKHKRSCELA